MRKYFALFLVLLFLSPCVYAKKQSKPQDPNIMLQQKSVMEKCSFWKKWKKKKRQEKPKMVSTRQEWLQISQSIPLEERENPKEKIEQNKKLNKIEPPSPYFAKYNNPPGKKEPDLSLIKKTKMVRSEGIANEDFTKMAYVQYNYYASENQISSELFVLPLDTSKTRINRMLDANILKAPKKGNLKSAKDSITKDLMSALVIVDWAPKANIILLKEKTGSVNNAGLFRNNIYVALIGEDCTTVKYKKFGNLEEQIKDYWLKKSNIQLNFYRWDIKPLGFRAQNPNEVISLAFVYNENGLETYLGAWALNYVTGEVSLLSLENKSFDIIMSGIEIKFELE